MKNVTSYLYGFTASAELQRCYNRIHERRIARRKFRMDYLNRKRLSDRQNLEQDMERIGEDFRKAVEVVTNGQ